MSAILQRNGVTVHNDGSVNFENSANAIDILAYEVTRLKLRYEPDFRDEAEDEWHDSESQVTMSVGGKGWSTWKRDEGVRPEQYTDVSGVLARRVLHLKSRVTALLRYSSAD